MRIEFSIEELRTFLLEKSDVKDLRVNSADEVEVAFDHALKRAFPPLDLTLPVLAVVRETRTHRGILTARLVAKVELLWHPHIPTDRFADGVAEKLATVRDAASLPEHALTSRPLSSEEFELRVDLDAIGAAVSRRIGFDVSVRDVTLGAIVEVAGQVRPPVAVEA
ncbi:hypothetical protein [Demequina pelophila]|uniref:hypothetical protein n=1 Tax=Demequina pelophila TaxID=1638984 RepID=UPI000784DA49|nr:hypothetical protein [Demequina pelophila]